jgi:uncharacterized protein YecT (DUF1311 family)
MGRSDAASVTALFLLAMSCACFAKNPAAMPSAEKCKALPNMEAADCLSKFATDLDPILQQYYEAARAHIRKLAADERDLAAQDLNQALSSLDHAQASWRSYRDAHCDMIAELYTNGSGKGVGEAICIIDLSRLRIHELWEIGGYPGLPEPK